MIYSNQIRPGNYVRTDDGSYGIVRSIGNYVMVRTFGFERGYAPEQLYPIVITLDILTHCDFQLVNAYYTHKETNVHLRFYGDGDMKIVHNGEMIKEVSYLHDLQNTFFDITGKSLEPNLVGI